MSTTNIDTLVSSLYQWVETHSIEVFCLLSQPLPCQVWHHLRLSNVLDRIYRTSSEPLYTPNASRNKQEIYLYEYSLYCILMPTKTKAQNRTLLLGNMGNTLLKHDRQFGYWNQPLKIYKRLCYLVSREAGLCCYLVVHTENRLRSLQLFYFHLWPIHWLSLILSDNKNRSLCHAKILF
jgi:hypothetical protein